MCKKRRQKTKDYGQVYGAKCHASRRKTSPTKYSLVFLQDVRHDKILKLRQTETARYDGIEENAHPGSGHG